MLDIIHSDQINELSEAMSKAQGELTPAIKDSSNPFFKSKYADLSSVWNSCREVLSKNSIAVFQPTFVKDGQLLMLTILSHKSGQWMRSHMPVINEKGNVQGLGSALTYTRRYALSSLVGITCDEDDDGNASCVTKVTKKQVAELEALLASCDDVYVGNVEKHYASVNIHDWSDLSVDQYQKLYEKVTNKLKGKAI